jgi:hypothetical protein
MRLIAQAKAGYYPTPPATLAWVRELLEEALAERDKGAALDPCAGEGEALFALAEATGYQPHAVELSEERARACAKRLAPLKGRTHAGDSLTYTGEGFSLLWLNPPYDWDGEGKRLEEVFLLHWLPALEPRGILGLLVPRKVLPDLWPRLRGELSEAQVYELPKGEGKRFDQVLLLGLKAQGFSYLPPLPPEPLDPKLHRFQALALLRQHRPSPARPRLRPALLAEEATLQSLVARSPLWKEVETVREIGEFRPLLPLKPAHLALLVAGGLLDLAEVEMAGAPHLVLGTVRKEEVVEEDDEEVRTRERFAVRITALNLQNGNLLEVK